MLLVNEDLLEGGFGTYGEYLKAKQRLKEFKEDVEALRKGAPKAKPMPEPWVVKPRHLDASRSFFEYLSSSVDVRFWQALSVWSGYNVILTTALPIRLPEDVLVFRGEEVWDPFMWEGKERLRGLGKEK